MLLIWLVHKGLTVSDGNEGTMIISGSTCAEASQPWARVCGLALTLKVIHLLEEVWTTREQGHHLLEDGVVCSSC